MEVKVTLQGFHQRGVCLLQFSEDGSLLLSVGQDDDHSIAVYEWATGTLRGSAKGDRGVVMAIDFLPGSTDFLSCGAKHVKFWARQGLNISSKQISCKKKADISFTTIGWLGPNAVLGTGGGPDTGEIMVVNLQGKEKNMIDGGDAFKKHQGPIFAMYTCRGRNKLLTGGKDGKIVIWVANEQTKDQLPLAVEAINIGIHQPLDVAVRSVQLSSDGTKILFGTLSSEIYEMKMNSTEAVAPLVQGHYKVRATDRPKM